MALEHSTFVYGQSIESKHLVYGHILKVILVYLRSSVLISRTLKKRERHLDWFAIHL